MSTPTVTIDTSAVVARGNRLLRQLYRNPKSRFGIFVLTPIVLASVFARPFDVAGITVQPFSLAPHDPLQTDIANRYAPPGGTYLLGTDHVGRDILSRTLLGGRTSLLLGAGATLLALVMGVPIGMVAGYKGGRIDEALMRLMDSLMSIPTLLLGILILTVLPPSVWNVIIAVGIVYAPRISRVVRSATLSETTEEYVLAAEARGESDGYILFREIFPNITAPIVVEGSIRVGFAILIGTSLSFLGLGAQPPYPDWGFMIATARGHIYQTPWFLLWPSLALAATVLSINMLGDGLRDILDPKVSGGER